MQIEMKYTGHYVRYPCQICGEPTGKMGVSFQIIGQENDELADVCEQCLIAAQNGKLEERIDQHIENLKDRISNCEHNKSIWLSIEGYPTPEQVSEFEASQFEAKQFEGLKA